MNQGLALRIEATLDTVAAISAAAAIGYAVLASGGAATLAAAAAALAFAGAQIALRAVRPEAATFAIRHFAPVSFEFDDVPELLLTEVDRVNAPSSAAAVADVLVLKDVLAQVGPDARVVRMFDRARMPTPGQLGVRIDQHVRGTSPAAAPPDASQALFQALAELRNSLR